MLSLALSVVLQPIRNLCACLLNTSGMESFSHPEPYFSFGQVVGETEASAEENGMEFIRGIDQIG